MEMEKLVSLCRRRGFLFQSSEIYGGLNGFWDYGPLGVELKRNVKEAWWRDMVTAHDDLAAPEGAPRSFDMTGLDCTIIMHPQVWKCSGHYDLFVDKMVDCRESKGRHRYDQVHAALGRGEGPEDLRHVARRGGRRRPEAAGAEVLQGPREGRGSTHMGRRPHDARQDRRGGFRQGARPDGFGARHPDRAARLQLMFPTTVGALAGEEGRAFLRPETAQGIFVNFKNVIDSAPA